MKTYSVTIQSVITKTIEVQAESEIDAYNDAHELFNPYSGESEDSHEQTTLDIKEVTA